MAKEEHPLTIGRVWLQALSCTLVDDHQRILELRKLLDEANYAYFVDADPLMPDSQYDELLRELVDLEAKNPDLFDPSSPSQRVGGAPVSGFESAVHSVPMQSIDNTYTIGDLENWYARVAELLGTTPDCTCDPKIDGVAISLRYEKGILVKAVTRGDGERGDDVTQQARRVRSIPLHLRGEGHPRVLEIRGEIFMPNSSFEMINTQRAANGEPLFANARNATAGTLKSLDPSIVAERKLSFLCHGRGKVVWEKSPKDWSNFVSAVKEMGIPASDMISVCQGSDSIVAEVTAFESQRAALGFGIDGMVVRINSFAQQETLGSTSKSPRWCIAFKYPAQQGETLLTHVEWQVGKNGTLTPRATMEPILLAGTTVQHATLHNIEEIRRKDIRVGDTVVVEKAGEIIPQVVGFVEANRDGSQQSIDPPAVCPTCDGPVEQEGPKLYCVNPECPAQFREKVKWFAGRDQMNIDGLGDKVVDQLIDAGLVHHFADLYNLVPADLLPLEGFAQKSADALVAAITQSKNRGLARVLSAVGIRLIGRATARTIAKEFCNLKLLQQASVDDFVSLHDFGLITAEALHVAIHSVQGKDLFQRLQEVGVALEQLQSESASPTFSGKTFVITGSLEHWERKTLTEELEQHGAKVTGTVSKNTDIVIAGEKAGLKLEKAHELGIEVWDESQLASALSE